MSEMAGRPRSVYLCFAKGSMASNSGTLEYKGPYELPGKGPVNYPLQQSTCMGIRAHVWASVLADVVPHEIPVKPHLSSSKADGTKVPSHLSQPRS